MGALPPPLLVLTHISTTQTFEFQSRIEGVVKTINLATFLIIPYRFCYAN